MKKELFPFLPLPIDTAKKLSTVFNLPANSLMRAYPNFKKELSQADIDFDARSYFAISMLSASIFFLVTFSVIFIISLSSVPLIQLIPISLLFSILFTGILFGYNLLYPKLLIYQKNRMLERDLLFALKYILIKIKSGIPLYDAMVSVAYGNFGEVSKEFANAVKEMSGGIEEIKALERMAMRNSSIFFRRIIWQIVNNLKSGTDISDVLSSITENLVQEQKIMIRKYGAELNPIILLYMMFSVVIPSLGVTVIIVMSSFSGITVPLYLFYLIPIAVFVLQLIFISIVKNKRPMLSIGV